MRIPAPIVLGATLGWLVPALVLGDPADVLESGLSPSACFAPEDLSPGGVPLTFLCSDIDHSPLDNPIDEGADVSVANDTRAGAFSPDPLVCRAQLYAARPLIPLLLPTGPTFFELLDPNRFPKLDPLGEVGLVSGVVRGQLGQAARAEADPEFLARHGLRPAPAGADPAALRAQAAATLSGSLNEFFPTLLLARPDPPIDLTPTGAAGAARLYPAAFSLATIAAAPQNSFRPGVDKAFYCQEIDPSADCFIPQAAPPIGDPGNLLLPRFVGLDEVGGTADDLPIAQGGTLHKLYLTEAADQAELALIGVAQDRRDFFPLRLRNGDTRIPVIDGVHRLTEAGHPGPDGVLGTVDDGCIADGVNANGECILLLAGSTMSVAQGVLDPEAIPLAGDPSLRPASALREPVDLTDLGVRVSGIPLLLARPQSPAACLFFPTSSGAFSRRVDPFTGAPVNAEGSLSCALREDSGGEFVGPDGDPQTFTDNLVPSIGNCLLFDDPQGPALRQPVRESDQIALSHSANQALFHSLCTLDYDQDFGFCALDVFNSEALGVAIASALSGGSLSRLAVLGTETIRSRQNPYTVSSNPQQFVAANFGKLRTVPPGGDISDLDFRRRALLGCGTSFGSGCGASDGDVARTLLELPVGSPTQIGIDTMNADAIVLSQEFTILKAASPTLLVGTRNGSFEAGVTVPALLDENGEFLRAFDANDARGLISAMDPTDTTGATAAHARASDMIRSVDGRFALSGHAAHGGIDLVSGLPLQIDLAAHDNQFGAGAIVPTDFVIEPPLWPVITADSVQADFEEGRIDATERDRLLGAVETGLLVFQDVRLDVSQDSLLAANLDLARINRSGENCTPLFGGPDPGCSDLEIVSANLERLEMANELIGGDDVLDLPETFEEVVAIFDGDPSNDLTGDPISGPDGIVFNDFDIDGSGGVDRKAVGIAPGREGILGEVLLGPGLGYLSCLNRASPLEFCIETFGNTPDGTLVASAMPIGIPAEILDASAQFVPFLVKATELDPLDFQLLVRGSTASVHEAELNIDVAPPDGQPDDLNGDGVIGFAEIRFDAQAATFFSKRSFGVGDLNDDQQPDLDEDRDGVFDGVDDGTEGPVDDGSFLCGSGVPGDPLNEAPQLEFVNPEDHVRLEQWLGGPLPPRSPLFCKGLLRLRGLLGPTPGVDRLDAIWHGGVTTSDLDGDTVPDHLDTCLRGNDALDADADGVPDACQCECVDPDGDDFCSVVDTCPVFPNPEQLDADGDQVGDECDNCQLVPNTDQIDADGPADDDSSLDRTQHYGNVCDADLNNDGSVGSADFFDVFRPCFGKSVDQAPECAAADLDTDGSVGTADFFSIFRPQFGGTPGPGITED